MPGSLRSRGGRSRAGTGPSSGRCGSTRASPPPRSRTAGTASSSTQGQTGLSVAFDLPTQIGFDSDHPLARGEVGKVGVPIASLEDMETLLDGIPLDERVDLDDDQRDRVDPARASSSPSRGGAGTPWTKLSGTIQNDILKEYAARGTYAFPPKPSLRLVTDIFALLPAEVPRWNTISISGYHIREAGSTAVQEVAFTLADGLEYLAAAEAAGLDPRRSRRASRSSSTSTTTSSRRSRSSGRRGPSGRGSSKERFGIDGPARARRSGSTRRRRARRSRRSSPT